MEYLLRSAFRVVPLPQWKELGQRISLNLGFGGDVSEVTASSPEKTDEAFHFSYKYTRKEFGDWANHRTLWALPQINLPAPGDEDMLPLGPSWLGPSTDILFHSSVELPSGYRPELPAAIHLKHDFAQYDATYDFRKGALIGERHLKTLLREVPVSEREQYKQFVKTVQDDYGVFIPLLSGSVRPRLRAGRYELNRDEYSEKSAGKLEPGGNAAGKRGARRDGKTRSAERCVFFVSRSGSRSEITRAWVILGGLLLMQKQKDAGVDAFHKAMAADPDQPAIPKALGFSLMANSQLEDAVVVWQDFVKAHPDDVDGPTNLGSCFVQLKRYSEAVAEYEAAFKIKGEWALLQFELGSVYLLAGNREKAEAAFGKLADLVPKGNYPRTTISTTPPTRWPRQI